MLTLTKGQKLILEKALHGDNLFVTGGGGVGKSFIVNYIVAELEKSGKTVLVTASTGKAAMLLGGVTCHRACQIPIKMTWLAKPTIDKKAPLYETDVLVIDEVSMLRLDAFDFIIQSIEKINELRKSDEYRTDSDNTHWDPIQIIIIGDFCQLSPVIIHPKDGSPDEGEMMSEHYGFDVGEGYAFLAPGWERSHFSTCELTEVLRQTDKPMIDALNGIRFGDRAALSYFKACSRKRNFSAKDDDVIYLCGKNKTAEWINKTALLKLPGKEREYYAECHGQVMDQDKQAPDRISLKVGAHVIMVQNAEKYRNGSSGTITAMYTKSVSIEIHETGEEIDVPYTTWNVERYVIRQDPDGKKKVEKEIIGSFSQLPLRLGYAMTIHKSQGQTFDKVSVILGSNDKKGNAVSTHPEIFAYGQLYVALSRVKSMDGLYIEGNLDLVDKLTAPEVLRFYRRNQKKPVESIEQKRIKKKVKKQANTKIPETKKTLKESEFVTLHCSQCSIGIAKVFVESLSNEAAIISGTEIRIPLKYKEQAKAFINALP